MATLLPPPEQRVVIPNVSWETYERLLTDLENSSAPRLTYDRGTLEIMSPLAEHEELNRALALLVEVIAEERRISVRNLGSTTFKREDLERGFEPDSCFYIQNVARIRGKRQIDLVVDPPPDLVIEIDITHPSISKLPIFCQLGVPEVWCHDGQELTIYVLESGAYRAQETSLAFPELTAASLTRLAADSQSMERLDWLRMLRGWARTGDSTEPERQ